MIFILVGVAIAFTVVFVFWADDIVRYIQEIAVHEHEVNGEMVREQIKFSVISPLETFSTTMRVSFYASLVFAYPWAMLQIYLFVSPGLYRHERRYFQIVIPSIFVLFFAGAAFGRYVLLPISIPFLLDFNVENFDVAQHYTLGEFLGLVFTLTFGLGFIFQIPLLVAPLIRFGLLTPQFIRSKRRYTIIGALIIGAIVSPTGSPIDMLIAGAPVFVLVELGMWMGVLWKKMALRKAQKLAIEAAERGEIIDTEELAGGLAMDLERKLKEFASGGAREFAREFFKGLNQSGDDLESVFDDDHDDEDAVDEVKLKPVNRESRRKKREEAEHKPEFVTEPPETDNDEGSVPRTAEDEKNDEEWPDRPWDENVNEDLAQYIDDRVAQRMEQFFEREIRPVLESIEHRLDQNRRKDDE